MRSKRWCKIYAVGAKPSNVTYLSNALHRSMYVFTSQAVYVNLEIDMMNRYGDAREQHRQAIIKALDNESV